jgi:hypothetical protein
MCVRVSDFDVRRRDDPVNSVVARLQHRHTGKRQHHGAPWSYSHVKGLCVSRKNGDRGQCVCVCVCVCV